MGHGGQPTQLLPPTPNAGLNTRGESTVVSKKAILYTVFVSILTERLTLLLKPIPRRQLSVQAYEAIKAAILDGSLPPELVVSEPQLAERLMISRSPIRDAIGRLEMEGFLARTESGRLKVASLDISELEQLYILRASIEGLATRLATFHLTLAHLEDMARAIELMRIHSEGGEVQDSLDAGAAFHELIHANCGNRPVLEAIEMVKTRIVRFRRLIASTREHETRISEHLRIHQAFLSRDPVAAERAMIEHVQSSAHAVISAFRNADRQNHEARLFRPRIVLPKQPD